MGLTGRGSVEASGASWLAEAEAAVMFAPVAGLLFGAFAGSRGVEVHAAALDALARLAKRQDGSGVSWMRLTRCATGIPGAPCA
ncbi:hypothetical protein [Corallococcus sp. 4LFB]|uniref:hypothetical protein n=1 Tax=Corallococcus sp. 4LFB TaxID=3383249 RepID=UPI0039753AA8